MTENFSIIRPDDWHVHLRDGEMLRAVVNYTARFFARAIIMPNLKPPVVTSDRAKQYREEIRAVLQVDADFNPLMTVYLTDTTDADDLERGHNDGVLTAAKLYPANATTNSESGISERRKAYPALERMQRIGMPLLIHGEVTDPDVDIFDREAVFIERELIPLRRDFPKLKIVLEHVTTEDAVEYIKSESKEGSLAATITAHHLSINRNAIFAGGIRPHNYCLPVAKREKHRQALLKAATSGLKCFFLGTDSAPHPVSTKECACGCAGIFTAPNAMEVYAHVFDEAGRLDVLEGFASINGAKFYGLPVNTGKMNFINSNPAEIKPILTRDGQKIEPFAPPFITKWRVV